jgi:hypothetical protein
MTKLTQTYSNPCTRCGKERIFSKTWTEEVELFMGTSTIVHNSMICPDEECQKIVEAGIEKQRKKDKKMKNDKDKREKIRIAENARNKKAHLKKTA